MGRAKGENTLTVVTRRGDSLGGLSSPQLAQALGIEPYNGDVATVDEEVVSRIAELLKKNSAQENHVPDEWDEEMFWNGQGTPEERSQFYAIGNAINFRFWEINKGTLIRTAGDIEGKRFNGAMYMWRALKTSLDNGVPLLDASFLANMTEEDYDMIFQFRRRNLSFGCRCRREAN